LAEKGLAWEGIHLNLRKFDHVAPEFLAINPAGMVPVLIDQGEVVSESRIINEYLEDAYPEVTLLPKSAHQRARVRNLTRFIDQVVSEAVKLPSFAKNIQPGLQNENTQTVLDKIASIPDPQVQSRWRLAATGAIRPADFEHDVRTLQQWLDMMERDLAQYAWLSGDSVGLADVDAAPFVQRLLRIDMGSDVAAHPHVNAWFQRFSLRPSFLTAMPALGTESQVPSIS